MTRLRRSFTAEFKLEAASLVLDQGYSVPEASRSLDVGETVLRRWVQQLQSERTGTTPISKALTPEQQKIQNLEARINRSIWPQYWICFHDKSLVGQWGHGSTESWPSARY